MDSDLPPGGIEPQQTKDHDLAALDAGRVLVNKMLKRLFQ